MYKSIMYCFKDREIWINHIEKMRQKSIFRKRGDKIYAGTKNGVYWFRVASRY